MSGITIEEFKKLPEVGVKVRGRKVDWDAVREDILGTPMSVRDVMLIAEGHKLTPDAKILYSEVLGFLKRQDGRLHHGKKLVLLRKLDTENHRFVYLLITEEDAKTQGLIT